MDHCGPSPPCGSSGPGMTCTSGLQADRSGRGTAPRSPAVQAVSRPEESTLRSSSRPRHQRQTSKSIGCSSGGGSDEQGSLWLGCCGWMVSPTVSVRVRRRLMGSLIDELQRRAAAAREEAEELRGRIAQLTERLAGVEERLSRLVITRETVEEVLNGAGAEAGPATVS